MSASTNAILERIDSITAEFRLGSVRSEDDTLDLRYGVRYAGTGEPARYVVFLNGRTEWLEKYAYVAEDLNLPDGTAFLAWDHRGQGGSGGLRSYVDDYDTYASDTARIVAQATGGKPYVVVAHSMGGLIALYSTLAGRLAPAALVLCSPLLGLPNAPVPRRLARPLATLLTMLRLGPVSSGAGDFGATPFADNTLTHQPDLYRRIQDSPFKIPGATFGWVAATFRAIDACFDPQRLAALSAPTLVLGAGAETVVDADAFKAWVLAASRDAKAEVQLRLLPGARHELLSEIPDYYEPTLAAIRSFLKPYWAS